MKKTFFHILWIVLLLFSHPAVRAESNRDYQKYGRIALTMVKEQYPDRDIEYQYLGRRSIDESKVVDTFRFEVLKGRKQVFVHVRVLHDEKNDKHLSMLLEEKK